MVKKDGFDWAFLAMALLVMLICFLAGMNVSTQRTVRKCNDFIQQEFYNSSESQDLGVFFGDTEKINFSLQRGR